MIILKSWRKYKLNQTHKTQTNNANKFTSSKFEKRKVIIYNYKSKGYWYNQVIQTFNFDVNCFQIKNVKVI